MNIERFVWLFDSLFTTTETKSTVSDQCPDIIGMTSPNKQRLLNAAFYCLSKDEAYLEVGTYQGKSLIGAALDNPRRSIYACDNFSEFQESNSFSILAENLKKYGMDSSVQFYDQDFRTMLKAKTFEKPIGVYFYDGAHDYDSQYNAISLAESVLSDNAIVIIDDWRFSGDSHSYAKRGTMDAVSHSDHIWSLLYELPARFNGDVEQWWNGVGLLTFQRRTIGE